MMLFNICLLVSDLWRSVDAEESPAHHLSHGNYQSWDFKESLTHGKVLVMTESIIIDKTPL